MPDKHFGKGFAAKHFAQDHFATSSTARVVDCNVAIITVTAQQATVVRASERVVDCSVALVAVIGQAATIGRGRTVNCNTAQVSVTAQTAQILRGGRHVDATPGLIAVQALPAAVVRARTVQARVATIQIVTHSATVVRGSNVGYLAANKVVFLPEVKPHNKCSGLYIGSDSILMLQGLVNRDGEPVTDAEVTLETFVDAAGLPVAGISLPLTLLHVSDGDYEAAIPDEIGLMAGHVYKATVRADRASIVKTWTETVLALRAVA